MAFFKGKAHIVEVWVTKGLVFKLLMLIYLAVGYSVLKREIDMFALDPLAAIKELEWLLLIVTLVSLAYMGWAIEFTNKKIQ